MVTDTASNRHSKVKITLAIIAFLELDKYLSCHYFYSASKVCDEGMRIFCLQTKVSEVKINFRVTALAASGKCFLSALQYDRTFSRIKLEDESWKLALFICNFAWKMHNLARLIGDNQFWPDETRNYFSRQASAVESRQDRLYLEKKINLWSLLTDTRRDRTCLFWRRPDVEANIFCDHPYWNKIVAFCSIVRQEN